MEDNAVAIVDDDSNFCESMMWLLKSRNLYVESFNTAETFLKNYKRREWKCLLIDIRMPKLNGLQLLDKLNKENNKAPVIMISGHADIPMAVRAIKLGAYDFLTKPFNDKNLLNALDKALLLENINEENLPLAEVEKRVDNLTHREKQTLHYIIQGKLNKQIADLLNISIKTVELHRRNVMQKMHAKTAAELAKLYLMLNYKNNF